MLKQDAHKRALDRFEKLVDLAEVARCEQIQKDMFAGKPSSQLPCIVTMPEPADWPQYSFTECWDDVEKNFISGLGHSYCGALLRDDRLFWARPEYGVVNIPELFGVKSVVTNEGRSMSEGVSDLGRIKQWISAGVPNLAAGHACKVDEWYDLARQALSQHEKLSKAVHFVLPDSQGPFDLACLVHGSAILTGVYDYPELLHQLLDLVTKTYIAYNERYKAIMGEPADSGCHIAGLKLVRGGVRICDDSATLASATVYREFAKPYNLRCFEPFKGGWLHFCGHGNHLLDEMLDMAPVHYLHLGNPDYHDFVALIRKTAARKITLFWSGSLDRIGEAWEIAGHSRLLVLTENRYASAGLDDARENLKRVRACLPIAKAAY